MRPLILFLFVIGCIGCGKSLVLNKTNSNFVPVTGEQFFKDAMTMQWKQRDSFAVKEILAGNIPRFLLKLIPINVTAKDTTTGKVNRATFYVMPDYLSVGTNKNWARIPLTPIAAQLIADSLQCFLPTRKMVNDIYANAAIK